MTDSSDLSPEELALLAEARRELAPNVERAARVLSQTQHAIASGAEGPAGLSEPSALKLAIGSTLLRNAAAWTAVAAVSAALGYYAGFKVGEEHAREQSALAPRPDIRPSAPREAVEPVAPVVVPHTQAEPVVAGPALEPPVAPKPRGRDDARAIAAPAPAPAPAVSPPAFVDTSSLDAEVKALRSVERALRNREPRRALELLAQLDRDIAQGQLQEERAAARAVAQCEERAASGTADRADVMQRVLEFSQRYPASVYFARVRRTCFATIDDGSAMDSGQR